MRKKRRIRITKDPSNRPRRKRRKITDIALLWIVGITLAASAFAQNVNESVDLEDFGFTMPHLSAARPAGLAGAYTALGGDVHALVYNPAGLAQTNRIEFSLGFRHDRQNNSNGFFGEESKAKHSVTDLDYLAVAYPFPTYRGSLVGAFGIYRDYSSELELLYSGFNTLDGTTDNYLLQQSGSIFSYNFGFGVDLSPSLSGGASFFILDGTIKALTQFSYSYPGPFTSGDFQEEYLRDDVQLDVNGYGGRLGVQFQPLASLLLGLNITTPIWVKLEGDGYTNGIDYYYNTVDTEFSESGDIKVEYRLPFQVDVGVGFKPGEFVLLSADLGYADWTETTIDKIQIKTGSPLGQPSPRTAVFREVINFRTGVEFTMPGAPVRLRAGYSYLPYPLKYLQADRITNDQLEPAKIDTERQSFALGAGALLSKVLALDFAFVYTTGERSIPTLDYKRNSKSFLLSSSYRF